MQDLVRLCKYTGERFDLVQAGGGNISMKSGGILHIKASGYHLSEIEKGNGIVSIENNEVLKILQDKELLAKKRKEQETQINTTLNSLFSGSLRPSIEVFMHSLFNTFTLHTHPLATNSILCSQNAEDIIRRLFPQALFIEYDTPGYFLSEKIFEKHNQFVKKYNTPPEVAFLRNHGLVVSCNSVESALALQEDIITQCEQFLGVDYSRYKRTNKISEIVNDVFEENIVTYLSEDTYINENFEDVKQVELTVPTFPDQLVYCGFKAISMKDIGDQSPLISFKDEFFEHPKMIVYDGDVFLIAKNVKKAREIEEVCKSFLLINANSSDIRYLAGKEQMFLANWDAEKFRRNL